MWETTNAAVIAKIKAGTVTFAELLAGAIQRGAADNNYGTCPNTGNGCLNVYAVSIPGVPPSRFLIWFQAAAAARNAGKRLPTNAEWTAAALGTPDPGAAPGPQDCNTNSAGPSLTGARANCDSDVEAFDMVGNLSEWVADWVPPATTCSTSLFGTGDENCMTIDPQAAVTPSSSGPGALFRGGDFADGAGAGVFAVNGLNALSLANQFIGFRAARES